MSTTEQKLRILLVEDSRSEAAIVKALLSQVDGGKLEIHNVGTFAEAELALRVKKHDAVLLDLGLPDSEGTQSIATLNKDFPDLPIIILSGHEDEVAVLRSLKYGAEAFLIKSQTSADDIWQALMSAIFRKSLHKSAASPS